MSLFWDTALVTAALGVVGGAFVPTLIARVPEPEPEVDEEGVEHERDVLEPAATEEHYARRVDEEKVPYAEVARLPGLRWKCALACGVAAGGIGAVVGWHWALLFLLYLVPVGAALSVIDWRTRYLPTWLIAPSYVVVGALVVLTSALTGNWHALLTSVVAWIATFVFFFVVWRLVPKAWAYGDVRLAGLLGMALGWAGPGYAVLGLWLGFFISGFGGLALSGLRIFHHKHVPMGPGLIIGAWVAVVFIGPIGDGYVHLVEALSG